MTGVMVKLPRQRYYFGVRRNRRDGARNMGSIARFFGGPHHLWTY